MLNKRSLQILSLILLCIAVVVLPVVVLASDTMVVAVNQSRVLTFSGLERVAVANPDIADVLVVSGSELLLVGKAPGTTTLHVWSAGGRESYQVEVAADDVPIANEIKAILGFEDLRISKIGKTIIMEGKVNSLYQKTRAETVAGAYGEKVINLLEITNPIQVKIEAIVIEIDRTKTKDLGIIWGNDAVNAPGGFAFGQSATNSNMLGGLRYTPINAQLSALVKNGSARILSRPNIITVSGDKANIMVGGQIPVPVSNQNGQISIEWKDYGVKLDIAPEVNAERLINSKIKAEVSSLDWDSTHKIQLGTNLVIPPMKMSRVETAMALSSGQTLAIGGLISSQVSNDVTKVPFLADLPILGSLFKSTSFNRDETELIILITPSIVNPVEYTPKATVDMKEFVQADPWGGNKDGGKDKGADR